MVKKITKAKIILQFLDDYGRKYYLREIAELLKKPHQTIKPYLEEFVREKILIETKRKNLTEYSLNFKNQKIYDYLVIAEKERLMEKLDEEVVLKVLFEKLSSLFASNTFVIFGSSAEKIKKASDIDLLIIGASNINKIINEFEDVYNKKIHKIQMNNIKKLDSVLAREIYKKHLIFNNTEYIIRFFGDLYEKNKLV